MSNMPFNEAVAYYMIIDGLSQKEAKAYVRGLEKAAEDDPSLWPSKNNHNPYSEEWTDNESDGYDLTDPLEL